ncbi:hypothetical protein [Methylobacterium sp. NEAU K]|uniref:hypothetical protein n=1 Tax=Methylobacterium sp. NEAU K TaxID=3064946 RepID=UPI002732FCA9|nr:hypothetical protein [Methylobacterium sp. NEAU K]MDP4003696.1 hypothetical protein [Methylobacterium sp. NEAU K]
MLAPGDRVTKPFGSRRVAAEADARATSPTTLDRDGPDRPARSLAWALRVSAVVGLLAVFAVHHLARLGQPAGAGAQVLAEAPAQAPARLASNGRPLPAEPETTGSITPAGAARAIRLDPCLLPALDPAQP